MEKKKNNMKKKNEKKMGKKKKNVYFQTHTGVFPYYFHNKF